MSAEEKSVQPGVIEITPGDHGVHELARIVILDRDTKTQVANRECEPGGTLRFQASDFAPHSLHAFKLQIARDGRWVDTVPYTNIKRDYSFLMPRDEAASFTPTATVVDPQNFGVSAASRVLISNPLTRRTLVDQIVPPDSCLVLPNALFDGVINYRFVINVLQDGLWRHAGGPYALIPSNLRGGRASFVRHRGGLMFTERSSVVIGPYNSYPARAHGTIDGFIRVHEHGEPVPEALRFRMGKQTHLFLPPLEPTKTFDGTFIYGGIPNPSFGHFLTEGVARLWFARDHADLPIVWQTPRELSALQQTILSLLGITNEHVHIHKPCEFAKVVFPVPGACLGSYFLKEHAEFMGTLEPAAVIADKRTYLSRSKLNATRGTSPYDDEIEDLLATNGFRIFHPEQYSVPEQLAEISSSEVVVGIEGSALHSVLLLRGPIATRFIAIGRHRMGQGIFEHIKQAKDLNYHTLNVREATDGLSARAALDIDMNLVERLITDTRGFREKLELLDPYLTHPDPTQANYQEALKEFRLSMTDLEHELIQAMARLHRKDSEGAMEVLAPLFQTVQVA